MFDTMEVFRMASGMASHAGRRQALVAENMANVDTPGYVARRMPSFTDLAAAPEGFETMRATRATHLQGTGHNVMNAMIEEDRSNPSPDGNTVSVEREMLEAVNVNREHSRALAIYRSAISILRTSVSNRA